MRATTNPDAEHWVRKLIDWWIDESGYPIRERSGSLRWFIRINDELHWADTREDLIKRFGHDTLPKSLTFIPAKLEDNPILMEKDPAYKANLDALPLLDRMRLKEGNWNAKASSGMFYRKEWFEIVSEYPKKGKGVSVRYWDRASTQPHPGNRDPDYTVGIKLHRDSGGVFYVTDIVRLRETPHKVEQAILNTARQDGVSTRIYLEQDPGQAGVAEMSQYSKLLAGFDIRFNRVTKDKQTRSRASSAQSEAGNIKIVQANWNEEFLKELASFPEGSHDDQCDALSGSINSFIENNVGQFTQTMTESNHSSIVSEESSNQIDW